MNSSFGRKKWTCLFLAAAMSLSMGGCSFPAKDYTISMKGLMTGKTAFRLNQVACPSQEARLYYINYRNLYGKSGGLDIVSLSESSDTLDNYVKQAAKEELSRIYSMDQMADQMNVALEDAELEEAADIAAAYYQTLTDTEIDWIGASQEEYTVFCEHYLLAEKLYDLLTLGVSTEVSEDEARVMQVLVFYTTHEDVAEETLERVQKGESFPTVAYALNSLGTSEQYLTRDDYPEDITQQIFALDNEQSTSEIYVMDGRYYLFYVENKYVEDLTEQNKTNVLKSRKNSQFERSYDIFAEEAFLEINDSFWEKLNLSDPEDINTDSFFRLCEEGADEADTQAEETAAGES